MDVDGLLVLEDDGRTTAEGLLVLLAGLLTFFPPEGRMTAEGLLVLLAGLLTFFPPEGRTTAEGRFAEDGREVDGLAGRLEGLALGRLDGRGAGRLA